MNRSLIALAVGAAFLAPGSAFADAKVYGKFNVALDHEKDEIGLPFSAPTSATGSDSYWQLHDANNSSRLGFKGSEDLGLGDLKAIYQLEYGINPDGTEKVPFSQRNIFVGLTGGLGTVRFGFYDTPVKDIGGNVDQFNDSAADIANFMVGETRTANLIQYYTPKLGDMVQVIVTVQPGEHRPATDDAAATVTEKGLADTIYGAVTYGSKVFDAGLAYAKNEVTGLKFDGVAGSGTATTGVDILRGTAQVKVVGLEVGALYQQAKGIDRTGDATALNGSRAKENSYLGSVAYNWDAFKFKAQYGQTKGDSTNLKRTETAAGVDYKLSKSTMTQLYYVTYKQEGVPSDTKANAAGVAVVFNF